MTKCNTKMLTTTSVLVAAEIVLSRFCSINAWNIKIGFGFVPVVIAAILYGPFTSGIVAALSDFIGAILFPVGMYFPGFTLTAFLTGLIYGLFLYKKKNTFRICGAVLINQLVLSLLLNSLWISVLYASPYIPLLTTRIIQCAILAPVQFVVISMFGRISAK